MFTKFHFGDSAVCPCGTSQMTVEHLLPTRLCDTPEPTSRNLACRHTVAGKTIQPCGESTTNCGICRGHRRTCLIEQGRRRTHFTATLCISKARGNSLLMIWQLKVPCSDWRTRFIYYYTRNGSDSVFAKCAYCSICLKQQHLHPFLPGKPCCVSNLFVLIACSFYFPHLVPVVVIYLLIYMHKFAVAMASKGVNHGNSGLHTPDFFRTKLRFKIHAILSYKNWLSALFFRRRKKIQSPLCCE